jgi:hypothetical protein
MAHTEALCNVLENIATKYDVDCVVITNSDGVVLVDPIYGPNAPRDDDDPDGQGHPTNAVLSFAQAQRHLAHLPAVSAAGSSSNAGDGGAGQGAASDSAASGAVVAAQYRDHVLVQFSEGAVSVTLTSRRTMGRCLGGLLAIVPIVRGQPVFKQLCVAVASES